jgi:PKD repeat protein
MPFWLFHIAIFFVLATSGLAGPVEPGSHLTLPALDRALLRAQDEFRERQGQPLRYAIPHYVSVTPQTGGTWEILGDGQRLWRFEVRAEGADSLNFGFGRYFMPAGGSLRILGPDGVDWIGPFTDRHNQTHGQLWTPPISGGEAIIEVRIPERMVPFLDLELIAVNYGYRPLQGFGFPTLPLRPDAELPKSGSCNVDVVCPEATPWQSEVRSVARISIGGSSLCSGFLVNNTALDQRPYFMTAAHCGITEGNAQTVVAYWNYQASNCGGAPNGLLNQFTSGAFFRAGQDAFQGSDFTLIELAQTPYRAFQPHWSGWDRGPTTPLSAVAIHHPNGDEKRISFDLDPSATPAAGLPAGMNPFSFLQVVAWEQGTTEPGSSGSGLWNQDSRIVGQLWGGSASCTNPGGSDYFGRFSVSWEGGGTAFTRLRDHLDPGNTGSEVLDGMDPCPAPEPDFTSFPNPAVAGTPVFFQSTVSGGTPPYAYAWDMNGDGVTDCATAECTFTYDTEYSGNVKLTVNDGQPCYASVTHAVAVSGPVRGVSLMAPNGGEVIPTGSRFSIRWAAAPEAVRFKLLRSFNGGATWRVIAREVTGSSFDWEVPLLRRSKKRARIKLIAYDAGGKRIASDRSGETFTVEVVGFTSLNGGQVLQSGEIRPVTWITHATVRPVAQTKILFSQNNGARWKLVERLSGNPGIYHWTVPDVKKTRESGRLKLVLLDEKGVNLGKDETDGAFAVLPP